MAAISAKAGIAGKSAAAGAKAGLLGTKVGLAAVGTLAAGVIATAVVVASLYGTHRSSAAPTERAYFLAVEETQWDMAPTRTAGLHNPCTNASYTEDEDVFVAGEAGGLRPGYIGSTYHIRQFRQYSSPKFDPTELVSVPSDWEHAAFFGPPLRVAVGETLRIRLRNKSRFPASFLPAAASGFTLTSFTRYEGDREAEGPVQGTTRLRKYTAETPVVTISTEAGSGGNGTRRVVLADPFTSGYGVFATVCGGPDDAACPAEGDTLTVPPGGEVEYVFAVEETAGPTASEGSTVARLYKSMQYGGAYPELSLTGPIIVARSGTPGDAKPAEVTAEVFTLLSVADENTSPYLDLNILDFIIRKRPEHAGSAAEPLASPIVPLDGITPSEALAALYQAVKGPADPAMTAAQLAAQFPSNAAQASFSAVNNVPLGLSFHLSAGRVDATSFVARYGQRQLEDTLAPLIANAFRANETIYSPDDFEESNLMHAVNGYVYCNTPGLDRLPVGGKIRQYIAVVGGEVDMHGAHWHGNVLDLHGRHFDSYLMLPGNVYAADMMADNAGKWLFHCHVTDHIGAGMQYIYGLTPLGTTPAGGDSWSVEAHHTGTPPLSALAAPAHIQPELTGKVREYFVQADIVQWSYTRPGGLEQCQSFSSAGFTLAPDFNLTAVAPEGQTTFTKAVFQMYTDATFSTLLPMPAELEHIGILGPIIRAEVGDTLRITFRNKADIPFSVHPHGVLYLKHSEGAPYADKTVGTDKMDDAVPPNRTWTYTWFVPESAGPGPNDVSSVPWLIHSHFHETKDEHAGIIGAIVVTRRGMARDPWPTATGATPNLMPTDVDREFFLLYKAFDEGVRDLDDAATEYSEHGGEGAHFVSPQWDQQGPSSSGGGHVHRRRRLQMHHAEEAEEEVDGNLYALNGKILCGLEGLKMVVGERVRWYLLSLGNEVDVHSAVFHGNSLLWHGRRTSGVPLLAGTMHSADMRPAVPGSYLVTDGSATFADNGLAAVYHVYERTHPDAPSTVMPSTVPAPLAAAPSAAARSYFIAAETTEWDYLGSSGVDQCVRPLGTNFSTAASLPPALSAAFEPLEAPGDATDASGRDLNQFVPAGRIFVKRTGAFLGTTYKKAVYKGYTDDSFATATPADPRLGLLGPTLHVGVGETISVTFNNTLSFETNLVFTKGLTLLKLEALNGSTWSTLYAAQSSTPVYAPPATSAVPQYRAVQPFETVRYTYYASPTGSAPGPTDPGAAAFLYSSSVDHYAHLYAGLMGAAVVHESAAEAAAAASGAVGAPTDLIAVLAEVDENASPFIDDNIARFAPDPTVVDKEDPDWIESNLMHGINGKIYCGLEGVTLQQGSVGRWHVFAVGDSAGLHTPSWYGNAVVYDSGYASAVDLYPGSAASVAMPATKPGSWLMQCGVNHHWIAGMRMLYSVAPAQA